MFLKHKPNKIKSMKTLTKLLGLFLATILSVGAVSAQNGKSKGQVKQKEKKVIVAEKNNRVVIDQTVKTRKGKAYAYGTTKTTPPGYIKGKKTGWTKGKGNKH
jgi:hypothetical protein